MARRLVVWCVVCAAMLTPGSARAEVDLDGNGKLDKFFITTTVAAVSALVATTAAVIYRATMNRRAEEVSMYLGENEAAARAAVLTGGGEAATDLAALFGVSPANEARFGRMLRASRGALLAELPAGGPTVEQAERFIALVIEGMRADEALGADVAYWEARRVAQE